MNNDMKDYYNYAVSPLGQVFYATVWRQLEGFSGKKILDFGSGFGFTSDYLAKNNDVLAIDPNKSMVEAACAKNKYKQIIGDIEELKKIEDNTFDAVMCHLVLEYVCNREEILSELVRVLKTGGQLSVVRHNKPGRIIQAIVQDYDLDDAKALLSGEYSSSPAFGVIADYENADIETWSDNNLRIEKVYGVRAVASLHDAKKQAEADWVEKMIEIEWELLKNKIYCDIAYFNHVILVKK